MIEAKGNLVFYKLTARGDKVVGSTEVSDYKPKTLVAAARQYPDAHMLHCTGSLIDSYQPRGGFMYINPTVIANTPEELRRQIGANPALAEALTYRSNHVHGAVTWTSDSGELIVRPYNRHRLPILQFPR